MRTSLADAGRVAELERRVLLTADFNFTANYNKVGGPVYVLEAPVAVGGVLEGFTGATKGTATLTQINGTPHLRYTPDAGAIGYDTFEAIVRYDDPYGSGSFTYYNNSVEVHIYLPGPSPVDDESFTYDDPNTGSSYYSNYFVLKGNSLTISADDGLLKNDQVGDNSNPLTNLTAIGVTPQNIHIHGGVLPQYGSVSVGGDGSFTYTPFASVVDDPNFSGLEDTFSYYVQDFEGQESETATVKVDLAEIYIRRDGLGVDANPEQLESWVGEEIAVSIGVKGDATLTGADIQWCAAGDTLDNYLELPEVTLSDGTIVPPRNVQVQVSNEEWTSPSPNFYWWKKGTYNLSVSVSTPTQYGYDDAEFDIKRPNRDLVAATTNVTITQTGQGTAVVGLGTFGTNGLPTSAGITFMQIGASGDPPSFYRFTQTVSILSTVLPDGGTLYRERMNALDDGTAFPAIGPIGNTMTAEDSPYTTLPNGWKSHTETFKASMYMMFRSGRANSIWTPLKETKWGAKWEVEKDANTGIWRIVTSSVDPPVTNDADSYPEWTRIYKKGDDLILF